MNVITNNGRRRLGIPGRPAIILGPGEHVTVDNEQLATIRSNKTVVRWIEAGVLAVGDKPMVKAAPANLNRTPKIMRQPKPALRADVRQPEVLPDGVTGEGVELTSPGGGWYQVYVNGFKVTDRNVRKEEADKIAAEYE